MASKHRPRDIELLMRFLEKAEDAWLAAVSPTGLQCSMLLAMVSEFQQELAGLELSEFELRAAEVRLNQLIAADRNGVRIAPCKANELN